MYKRQKTKCIWLLTVTDKKKPPRLISSLIKLNINEICGRTATWHYFSARHIYLIPYIYGSFPSFLILTSRFLFYISRLLSALYVFFCLVFFSFYLFVPFLLSCSPSGLAVSTIPFYLNLVSLYLASFFLIYLTFFLSSLSLLFSSLSFSSFAPRYFSISPSPFPFLSHPLSSQQLNPLERFSRWRAVKPTTTMWVLIINLKIKYINNIGKFFWCRQLHFLLLLTYLLWLTF